MIVALAHGSPDPRHAAGVSVLAERAGLVPAYLQHHGPTLSEVIADAEQIQVLPLLLSRGVHLTQDVPEAIAAARRPHQQWTCLPAPTPLLLKSAVRAAVEAAGGGPSSPIIGVAAGSGRPGALDGFSALAGELPMLIANGPREATARALAQVEGRAYVVPLMFAAGLLSDVAAETARAHGAIPTAPVGQFDECADALRAWVQSRATGRLAPAST